jgi:hypothetical protein
VPPARRLGSSWSRGVVASAAACGVLAGCSGTITIDDHDLSDADRAACEALVADLPRTLAGEDRVGVEPADALGAAWGGQAPYVLTCGVPEPEGYEPTAECNVIEGVGWYVPEDQLTDQAEDATPVALSRTPLVEVLVPAEHRTEGIDRALAELATALEEHLGEGLSCL